MWGEKKPGIVVHSCKPSAVRADRQMPGSHWPDGLAQTVSFGFTEKPGLRKIPGINYWPTHTHTHHTHTHTHTHTHWRRIFDLRGWAQHMSHIHIKHGYFLLVHLFILTFTILTT